jgi:N12 class adenine-specific DNA methylase
MAWDDFVGNLGFILASVIVIINRESIQEFLFSLKQAGLARPLTFSWPAGSLYYSSSQ